MIWFTRASTFLLTAWESALFFFFFNDSASFQFWVYLGEKKTKNQFHLFGGFGLLWNCAASRQGTTEINSPQLCASQAVQRKPAPCTCWCSHRLHVVWWDRRWPWEKTKGNLMCAVVSMKLSCLPCQWEKRRYGDWEGQCQAPPQCAVLWQLFVTCCAMTVWNSSLESTQEWLVVCRGWWWAAWSTRLLRVLRRRRSHCSVVSCTLI